ncbi:protein of unknown function [Pseudodesulfovibrio piezophilus C1TLV30]|uniref:Uncharacterized protein n=1 Tax=Pseudodesulfovibrio piezophilus (strain DSM 21447 / JCM 15486 / C1TLV30) TaxID=1322246 RepID=M1WS34_PSEP2|nr:protein of unknown function [Pseudodesulfovibrio piezophilus C1TLV30]
MDISSCSVLWARSPPSCWHISKKENGYDRSAAVLKKERGHIDTQGDGKNDFHTTLTTANSQVSPANELRATQPRSAAVFP